MTVLDTYVHACTLLKYFPLHLERRVCGTNYAKNVHVTSIGIPVGRRPKKQEEYYYYADTGE